MLSVKFFARVREQLDCSALELPWEESLASLDGLQEKLLERGDSWRLTLGEDNIIRAVNHTVVEGDTPLADGDEVAFYPPVTGG